MQNSNHLCSQSVTTAPPFKSQTVSSRPTFNVKAAVLYILISTPRISLTPSPCFLCQYIPNNTHNTRSTPCESSVEGVMSNETNHRALVRPPSVWGAQEPTDRLLLHCAKQGLRNLLEKRRERVESTIEITSPRACDLFGELEQAWEQVWSICTDHWFCILYLMPSLRRTWALQHRWFSSVQISAHNINHSINRADLRTPFCSWLSLAGPET